MVFLIVEKLLQRWLGRDASIRQKRISEENLKQALRLKSLEAREETKTRQALKHFATFRFFFSLCVIVINVFYFCVTLLRKQTHILQLICEMLKNFGKFWKILVDLFFFCRSSITLFFSRIFAHHFVQSLAHSLSCLKFRSILYFSNYSIMFRLTDDVKLTKILILFPNNIIKNNRAILVSSHYMFHLF